MSYVPTLVNSSTYNYLSYETDVNSDANTLWKQQGERTMALFGIGLSYELGFSPSSGLEIGLTYKAESSVAPTNTFEVSYTSDNKRFVTSNTKSTTLGFFTDYMMKFNISNLSRFQIPLGLGIDSDTVVHTSTTDDDNGAFAQETIAEMTSTIMVINLRTGSHFEYNFGSLGLRFGLVLNIPVSGESKSFW